jgi:Glycosyltransferase family 9 (heptosyltransferase)
MRKGRKEPIVLTHWRAPGDIVCMTACIRDLALTYPGRFEIHVAGTCPELWEYNPHVERAWGARVPHGIRRYRLSCYRSLIKCNQRQMHYLTAFHRDLSEKLAIPVEPLLPKGDLHLTDYERAVRPLKRPYWLVVAGGKDDITTKIWSAARFQEVVWLLRDRGIHSVQIGASLPSHHHPVLKGVTNMVGRTSLRDVLQLVYHAEGAICPVTFVMHVAAAFDKPCVVLAGGREPWWWAGYVDSSTRHFGPRCAPVSVPHRYLHAIGRLDCCKESGCWRTSVQGSHATPDNRCLAPCDDGLGQTIPRCLDLITPQTVVRAVLSYSGTGVRRHDPRQIRQGDACVRRVHRRRPGQSSKSEARGESAAQV